MIRYIHLRWGVVEGVAREPGWIFLGGLVSEPGSPIAYAWPLRDPDAIVHSALMTCMQVSRLLGTHASVTCKDRPGFCCCVLLIKRHYMCHVHRGHNIKYIQCSKASTNNNHWRKPWHYNAVVFNWRWHLIGWRLNYSPFLEDFG